MEDLRIHPDRKVNLIVNPVLASMRGGTWSGHKLGTKAFRVPICKLGELSGIFRRMKLAIEPGFPDELSSHRRVGCEGGVCQLSLRAPVGTIIQVHIQVYP